jgi:hypothetical protein
VRFVTRCRLGLVLGIAFETKSDDSRDPLAYKLRNVSWLKLRERSIALALLLITTACALIPFEPAMPGRALDEAWALGINEAVARGMVFGRDVAFTFGPYASIFSRAYHPATDWLMLLGSASLAVSYGYAFVTATRGSRVAPWAFLLALLVLTTHRDALLISYPLVAAVCVIREPVPRLSSIAVLMAPFGLLPIIKGSFAVMCGLVGAWVLAWFVFAKARNAVLVVLGAPTVSLFIFWLLAGQPLLAIPVYVHGIVTMASGYGDAMAIGGARGSEVVVYVLVSIFLLVAIVRDSMAQRRRRILTAVFASFLFVALKSGFTRHDSHALLSAASLSFAGVVYSFTFSWRWRSLLAVAAVAACIYVDAAYNVPVLWHTENVYLSAGRGLATRVGVSTPSYREQFDAALRIFRDVVHFPPLPGTTDIYSYAQTDLIASGARWNPRPVMQSYAAYAPSLAAANRDHLLGADAPDNVVFRVQPIDWHFPSLEDGASWWALLARYVPTTLDGDTLILHRRPDGEAIAKPAPLGEVTGKLGRAVKVPESDQPIFAEVQLQPSLLGRLAGALYKVAPVLITVRLVDGGEITYRYIASMGRAGFLLSPVVETTREMATLFGKPAFMPHKRVLSFKLSSTGRSMVWQRSFSVRFSSLSVPPSIDSRAYYRFDGPISDVVPSNAEQCEGVLDSFNDYPAAGELKTTGMLSVRGWVARNQTTPAKKVAIALTDATGSTLLFSTTPDTRKDVGDYFHAPAMASAGYRSTIDISDLDGRYQIGPAIDEGDGFAICPNRNHTVIIQPVR